MQFHGYEQWTDRGIYQITDVHLFTLEYNDACIQPGKFQQGCNQPVHLHEQAFHFPQQILPLVLIRSIFKQRQDQISRSKRRAKLMCNIGKRISKMLLLPFQRIILLPDTQGHLGDLALQNG